VKPRVNLLPGLAELIHDTMARDPERRPQTAADFLERLDRISMGLVQSGSWPLVMLPDGGRREVEASPAASAERRLSEAPADVPAPRASANVLLAPPSSEESAGAPSSLPGDDDEEEQTVVYGDAAPERAGEGPAIERGDEEKTMEADLDDSMDGLYDGPPDVASGSTTQESPAVIADARTRPPFRAHEPPAAPPGRAPWIAAAVLLAGGGAAVWWLTQRPEEAVPVRIAVGADAAPPSVAAAPPSIDEALLPADAIAGPRDFVPSPPSVAAAEKPSPPSALASHAPPPHRPAPPPREKAPDTDALLDRARRAYESMDAEQALTLYRQAFAQLPADHPEYFTVQQRIEALAKRVAPK
jgi:hypothetical protein